MVSELLHETGEWFRASLPMPDLRQIADQREQMATITLYSRYALQPFLGIAAEELKGATGYGAPPPAAPPTETKAGRKAARPQPAPAANAEPSGPPTVAELDAIEAAEPDLSSGAARREELRRFHSDLEGALEEAALKGINHRKSAFQKGARRPSFEDTMMLRNSLLAWMEK